MPRGNIAIFSASDFSLIALIGYLRETKRAYLTLLHLTTYESIQMFKCGKEDSLMTAWFLNSGSGWEESLGLWMRYHPWFNDLGKDDKPLKSFPSWLLCWSVSYLSPDISASLLPSQTPAGTVFLWTIPKSLNSWVSIVRFLNYVYLKGKVTSNWSMKEELHSSVVVGEEHTGRFL